MGTLKQPFIDGLDNIPENRTKDMKKIKLWMDTQPHLPTISDEYIYLFLHACYYQHDKTKHAIETYFSLKSNTPSLFTDRDVYSEKIQTIMRMVHLVRLPKTTPEGYKILLYSVQDTDYTKFVFSDGVKAFCMYNDCVLSEDGLAEGYIVIFDMKGVSLGHLARVSLPALRAFMIYIQDAHPARLKAIHCVNTANFINHVMRIIQPLIHSDLISMLKFHKGNVPEEVPLELLPSDYGGEAPSVKELDQQTRDLVDKYSVWLRENELLKSDESKRIKKSSWWSMFGGNGTTTNDLAVEEKSTFTSLEID